MKHISWVITGLILFSIFSTDMAFAIQKAVASKTQTPNTESELYKIAETDLDRRFYQAYRIVERIARANKLDNYSWRIIIPKSNDYNINAHTSDANAIILEPGFVDSFSGEISVLAYVIAHEMAHQIHQHGVKKQRYLDKRDRAYKDFQANNSLNTDSTSKDSIGIDVKYYLTGYYLFSEKSNREKIEEFTKIKDELENDFYAESRKYEYEADKTAISLMTKAGFTTEDSLRFFELVKRIPISNMEEKSTHPVDENRIWQIEQLLKTLNLEELKKEGKKNIAASKPLTYQKFYEVESSSKYRVIRSIVVNSKYGSVNNLNKPFEDLFGK